MPSAIANRLVRLCDRIGLDFAAADFMRDPTSGELVFLEVNSQPMFAAFDLVAGGRLCDAILDGLLFARNRTSRVTPVVARRTRRNRHATSARVAQDSN